MENNEQNIKYLPNSAVEMKFIVTPEEAKPYIDQAVTEISTQKPLKGFRPGKAGYADVAREYGEMLIWETALERIVRAKYVKTVLDNNLDTIGSPKISVEKITPNQPIEFTVVAAIMPKVTEVMDYSKPLVEVKKREVTDEERDKVIEDLRKMRRQEVVTDQPATLDDLTLIDLEITKDGVVVEGGTSKDYKVYMNEPHYIPGFAEQLVGAKKGDKREFELTFPSDHYNKQLAGQNVKFSADVKDVYKLELPALDEEFAKTMGLENIEKLNETIKKNMQEEADQKAEEAAEIELLEKLTKGSKFTEIPDILVNEEVHRMIHEMEAAVEEQGMKMEDYLASIKKTMDQLKLDFVPQALLRIQTAVLLKEIAKRENCESVDTEVDAEIDRILQHIKPGDTETREKLLSPEYRDYLNARMKNQKTLKALKAKAVGGRELQITNDE